jgi:hypothetical protein
MAYAGVEESVYARNLKLAPPPSTSPFRSLLQLVVNRYEVRGRRNETDGGVETFLGR